MNKIIKSIGKKLRSDYSDYKATGFQRTLNPSINTTSKKTSTGEIINPTKEDIKKYNKKYTTIRFKK